jgi:hypothetical protein
MKFKVDQKVRYYSPDMKSYKIVTIVCVRRPWYDIMINRTGKIVPNIPEESLREIEPIMTLPEDKNEIARRNRNLYKMSIY